MRRNASRALLLVPVVLLAAAVSSTAGAATRPLAPWAQNDSNGAQSRANLAERTLSLTTIGRVRYLRSVTSPPPTYCGAGIQAPLLAGGRVYDVETGYLTARSAQTGNRLWSAPPTVPDTSDYFSTAVSHGVVLLGYTDCISQSDPNSAIEAYNANTGRLLWRHVLDGYLSDLVVSGSTVVAEVDDSIGGGDDAVTAMRVSDGSARWGSSCAGGGHVVIVSQKVIYRCVPPNDDGEGTIQASDLASGADAWSAPGGKIVRGDSDAATGHHVYIQRAGVVDDVNPVTGQTRFSLDGALNVLAVDQVRVYATCAEGICAYAISNGSRLWAAAPPDDPASVRSAAEANGVLYLDSGDVLNAANGTFVRQLFLDSGRSIVIGDGSIGVYGPSSRVLDLYGLSGS